MPYRLKGILKSPNGQPLTGVDLQFIAQQTLSPVLQQTDHNIRLGLDGSYDVSLEFNTYAVKAQIGGLAPQIMGYIIVSTDTPAGLDLPQLLRSYSQEATAPDYAKMIEGWLIEAKAAADKATAEAVSAKAQADRAKSEADRAKSEADRASEISGLDTVADAIRLAAVPFPDVWIPFNDSLRMIAGFGRDVKVGADVVATHVNYERATEATYTDKSGVLRTASINEPRFEKEGLLIEGQSTNLLRGDNLRPPAGVVTSKVSSSKYPDIAATKAAGSQTTPIIIGGSREPIDSSTVYSASVIIDLANSNITTGLVRYRFAYSANWASRYIDVYTDGRVHKLGEGTTGSAKVVGDLLFISMTTTSSDNASTSGGGSVDVVSLLESGLEPSGAPAGYSVCVVGFQLEKSPLSSSYIPTSGTAVTRAADFLKLSRWGNDNYYSPITIACEIDTYSGYGATDTNSRRGIFSGYPSQGAFEVLMIEPSSKRVTLAYGDAKFTPTSGMPIVNDDARHIVGGRFNGTDSVAFTDGVISGTQVSSPVYGADNGDAKNWLLIGYGAGGSVARHLWGHIRNFRIWHSALSDAQIKGLK